MIWFYRILFLPILLLCLPYYLHRMWKRGGYRKDFQHRGGLIRRVPEKRPGVKRLWIQAVSVGELQALDPLLQRLKANDQLEVFLTTTTSTGYTLAREKYCKLARFIGIFPLDFFPFSRTAWKRIQPDAIILMESELWPEHLHQAKAHGKPALLINARMSDRSFRRYCRARPVARWLLGHLRHIACNSDADAKRFKQLAPPTLDISTTGNLKCDLDTSARLSETERDTLLREMGFNAGESLVLAGSSTWQGEEAFLLDVLKTARKDGKDVRLLLVPRHAERRSEIASLLDKSELPWHQRSKEKQAATGTLIYLADTTGELSRLQQLGDVVFVGKSLPPNTGGQTPIEAAAYGLPLVYGPHMSNFRTICQTLEQSHAAHRATSETEARNLILDLLEHPEKRRSLSEAQQAWHQTQRGATERTVKLIEELSAK